MFYDKIALVVDDSPTVSSFITHILKDALGFGAVRRAQSGQAGLQVFKAERIDWVFCDFEMPGMNGLEFLSGSTAFCMETKLHNHGFAGANGGAGKWVSLPTVR